MPHMQLIVDGETVYDDIIDDWMAPPKPDLIPGAVKAQANPNVKPPPFIKILLIASIGYAVEQIVRNEQRLQPLNVLLNKRPTGWSLHVDLPKADIDAANQPDDVQVVEP